MLNVKRTKRAVKLITKMKDFEKLPEKATRNFQCPLCENPISKGLKVINLCEDGESLFAHHGCVQWALFRIMRRA